MAPRLIILALIPSRVKFASFSVATMVHPANVLFVVLFILFSSLDVSVSKPFSKCNSFCKLPHNRRWSELRNHSWRLLLIMSPIPSRQVKSKRSSAASLKSRRLPWKCLSSIRLAVLPIKGMSEGCEADLCYNEVYKGCAAAFIDGSNQVFIGFFAEALQCNDLIPVAVKVV